MRALTRIVLVVLVAIVSVAVGVLEAGASPAPREGVAPLFLPPPSASPSPPADPGSTPPGDGSDASGDTAGPAPACFGAAAMDPAHACQNAGRRYHVVPDPADPRAAQRYETCSETELSGLLKVCYWGAPADRATRTIALVGDSHASHWRAAMQDVVTAKGWRGISIQRAGCPLTTAHPDLPGAERQQGCMQWNFQVRRWIAQHPQVDTVFTSAHLAQVIPPPGQSRSLARRTGYTSAWLRLLRGAVRHIVVIRDTPRISGQTIPCVVRAVQAMVQPPGEACALDRAYALREDPLVVAAHRLATPQVQVADLHSFMCDAARCYPVVGGVLVLRDVSHMTTTFSTTLGPYLLQTVNRLSADWPPSAAHAR